MIKIRDFDTYCKHLQNAISEIDNYVFAATEDHLVKRISDKTGIILAAVIPSADPDSLSVDNIKENNIAFLFVVKKLDSSSRTPETELILYEQTQKAITNIKKQLLLDKTNYQNFPYLHSLNENSIHTDPEFNIFGGYDGWSISLEFVTIGF